MNKNLTLLAAAVISLSACVTRPIEPGQPTKPQPPSRNPDTEVLGFDATKMAPPTRCVVNVHIVDDEILIDQEPVPTMQCLPSPAPVAVLWKLDRASIYTFAANGIEFKAPGPPVKNCMPLAAAKVFRCTLPGHSGQRYPYTITVLKNGAKWKELDPTFFNN